MLPELKPFDVVVIDGLWYMPHHWLIRWRGMDKGVHAVTVINSHGDIWNPIFQGIKRDSLRRYAGRSITVHRYKGDIGLELLEAWGSKTCLLSLGYDFFKQWLVGFILGLTAKTLVNDELRWTCAEFPYWGFTYNKLPLTTIEETLPMPRLFRYNDHFDTVFNGVYTP